MSKGKQIMDLLQDIQLSLDKGLKNYYVDNELTVPQLAVVSLLGSHAEMKISELSKELKVSAAATSNMVDRLESLGYVKRERSEKDRRIVYVSLTESFKANHHHIEKNTAGYLQLLVRRQDAQSVDSLINSLEFLKKVLDSGERYLQEHIESHL